MRRDARQMKLIWAEEEAGYFWREDWTGRIGLKERGKLAFARGCGLSVTSAHDWAISDRILRPEN